MLAIPGTNFGTNAAGTIGTGTNQLVVASPNGTSGGILQSFDEMGARLWWSRVRDTPLASPTVLGIGNLDLSKRYTKVGTGLVGLPAGSVFYVFI